MATFRGLIRHSALEGGLLLLEGEDGAKYTLEAGAWDPKGAPPDGTRVEVEGRIDKQVLSFAMSGPTLVVKSLKRL